MTIRQDDSLSRRWAAGRCALVAATLLLGACGSRPIRTQARLEPAKVPAVIEEVSALDIDRVNDERLSKAIGSLLKATRAQVPSEQLLAVRELLERTSLELVERGEDPADLKDLAKVDLPERIAVPAALRSARLYFEKDDRSAAFGVMRSLDERYPNHAMRQEAGDLLYEIATNYRDDKRRKLFLFPYSSRAPGVFEYLSTEYPSHERADDALVELANVYARDRQYDLAIDRHNDVLLWSGDPEHRVTSQAAIPMLRLDDLDGPEYGRDQLLIALNELEAWIALYGDHELRPDVDRALVDCLQRLADNDLVVARFYERVGNPEGARQHASRALEDYALRAGNEAQLAEIRDFLASVDDIERVDAPRIITPGTGPGIGAFDPAGTGTETGTGGLAPSEPLDLDSRRTPPEPTRREEGDPNQ